VGHFCEVAHDVVTGDGFAKEHGDLEFSVLLLVAGEHLFEAYFLGVERGHFNADGGFAGDGSDDADGAGLHVEGDVIF